MIRSSRIIVSRKLLREAMQLPPNMDITAIHYRPESADWQIEVVGDFDVKDNITIGNLADVGKAFSETVHEVQDEV